MSSEQFLTHKNKLIRECAKLSLKSSKYYLDPTNPENTKFIFEVSEIGYADLQDYSDQKGWFCTFHGQTANIPIWNFKFSGFVKTIDELLETLDALKKL